MKHRPVIRAAQSASFAGLTHLLRAASRAMVDVGQQPMTCIEYCYVKEVRSQFLIYNKMQIYISCFTANYSARYKVCSIHRIEVTAAPRVVCLSEWFTYTPASALV
jgi:hypothetical protein